MNGGFEKEIYWFHISFMSDDITFTSLRLTCSTSTTCQQIEKIRFPEQSQLISTAHLFILSKCQKLISDIRWSKNDPRSSFFFHSPIAYSNDHSTVLLVNSHRLKELKYMLNMWEYHRKMLLRSTDVLRKRIAFFLGRRFDGIPSPVKPLWW